MEISGFFQDINRIGRIFLGRRGKYQE